MRKKIIKRSLVGGISIVTVFSFFLFVYTGNRGEAQQQEMVYVCEKNAKVKVFYDNSDGKNGKAVVTFGQEKNRIMTLIPSDSGSKYFDGNYVWWVKEDRTAFITEAWGNEKMILEECRTR